MFDKSKIIPIGSDHAGYELKEFLKKNLESKGYKFKDYGCYSTDSVDYPDIAHALAKDISNKTYGLGILICGSGNGIMMAANKHKDVRAALCWMPEIARLARVHNDANILTLPGRFIDFNVAEEMVELFFDTDFEGGRHSCRVNKINE